MANHTSPGYQIRDMIYDDNFIVKNLRELQKVINHSIGLRPVVVVGYVDWNSTKTKYRNMVAAIQGGVVVGHYQKHLLPFYDVFDEGRYFETGTELTIVEICGHKWGLLICEDIWNDKSDNGYRYEDRPVQLYQEMGIDKFICVNSSPYTHGKSIHRQNMLKEICKESTSGDNNKSCIIYVNQVGGQDELVFDGRSCIQVGPDLVFCAKNQAESNGTRHVVELGTLDYSQSYHSEMSDSGSKSLSEHTYNMLVMGLRDYVHKSGFKEVVVGSSGGIDSALTLAIACEAVGSENVHAIMMPSVYSSSHSVSDAKALHANLKCNEYTVPISHIENLDRYTEQFRETKTFGQANPVAEENLQARMRGNIIMLFSNSWGALPLATGNKSELSVGYCTLYGDMCGGFAVLSDVYKTEVYRLARYCNNERYEREVIPVTIIDKEPSAELADGQKDIDSLPSYPILDCMLFNYIEKYISDFSKLDMPDEIRTANEMNEETFVRVMQMVNRAEFKRRQAPPGIKLCKVAFGSGRRIPIVKVCI